jgi:radical SAM/Cys-rich protein
MDDFESKVKELSGKTLISKEIHTFQVNISLKCNQECTHCHHQAGPERDEIMTWETMKEIVDKAREAEVAIIDITGGAPEENPNLVRFIEELKRNGHHIMVRTNLTALMTEEHLHLIDFFRTREIELIASLPCYEAAEVDCVRGEGVFDTSIKGLQELNKAGYGRDPALKLDLVFNPMADFLPPPQGALKAEYKEILKRDFDIDFTELFTITNMPIGRFWEDLQKKEKGNDYMELLASNFNPSTVQNLMCLYQLNIAWDGSLYDCDFNQAIGLGMVTEHASTIFDLDVKDLNTPRDINTGQHCFGCTAGAGSSCGGALTEE